MSIQQPSLESNPERSLTPMMQVRAAVIGEAMLNLAAVTPVEG